ncbi:thiamine pyrophosphokinase [Cryphonectria parasitica EP155]|uniref:Thiamine pyrophosphokinase n=1 Tax=Cryphonectria parasitica (strain ATCC 38755 / EP155) TaxID=660469 RepID=A0A9P4Y7J3_CRYP1|nr:thiamine pyrophosphokinase [Cryphonectria parasitica EP155]KAF3767936.1 thiamine pyrophosphokinase [Cryphonectria parasitica EP155]
MGDPIEWHPARMLLRERAETDRENNQHTAAPQLALIILNQPLRDLATLEVLWSNSFLRVAADGGADRLLRASQEGQQNGGSSSTLLSQSGLDVIIGDLDSLTNEARQYFTTAASSHHTKIIHDPDQYSTDFGKAVKYIRSAAASPPGTTPADIVAMGGLGGRVDQGLSQLHHLYLFQTDPTYAEGRLFLVSGESLTFLLKAGRHRVHVREEGAEDVFGKYVGIIPIKEPSVITLRGFEWDVTDWKTEFGGMMSTSNHVLPDSRVVEVETTKDVLFTISLKG